MSLRPVLAAGLALVVAHPAVAVPARRCPVVNDRVGDAMLVEVDAMPDAIVAEEPDDPSLDIRGVDVSGDNRTVTVVVRLAGYAVVDPAAPLGRDYFVRFRSDQYDQAFYLDVIVRPFDVPHVEFGTITTTPAPIAAGHLVVAGSELRITARIDGLPSARRLGLPGTRFTTFLAYTGRLVTDPFGLEGGLEEVNVDSASGSTTYTVGGRCGPVRS